SRTSFARRQPARSARRLPTPKRCTNLKCLDAPRRRSSTSSVEMTRRTFASGSAAASAAIVAAALWMRLGPLPARLLDDRRQLSTTVVDRRGQVLYEARSEEGTRGARLAADALPPNLVSATIAAEDRRFYEHIGVD